ncbi:MAG: ABC transporter permease subunit [Actinomycetaceae bacterium]
MVGIGADSLPAEPVDAAAAAAPAGDQIAGSIWFDFVRGGGGTNGEVGDGKPGLGGIEVLALDADGSEAGRTTTAEDGTFLIEGLDPGGTYTIQLPASSFSAGASGVDWLGPGLITPVTILAYVWIWAGFAMVMIASGLSAVDRTLQEAARTDGANEWQVFRRITVPQLAPVLMVVMVTLVINVLKIFDLVYVIPPGVSKPAADVIATRMWTVSFGGGNDQGLGSALAIFLLLLVLPAILVNIRNFRRGGQA